MPNWCLNTLTISVVTSDKESIEQLNTFMVIAESGESDLNMANIIRIPSDLKIEGGSVDMIYDAYYGDWVKFVTFPWVIAFIKENDLEFNQEGIIKAVEDRGYTKEQADQRKWNVEKYGHTSWYDWCIQNWGTKWGVQASLEEMGDEMLVYTFDSAWSPPISFVEKAAELFPNLDFHMEFEEPGMGFAGEFYGNHESGSVHMMRNKLSPIQPKLSPFVYIVEQLIN